MTKVLTTHLMTAVGDVLHAVGSKADVTAIIQNPTHGYWVDINLITANGIELETINTLLIAIIAHEHEVEVSEPGSTVPMLDNSSSLMDEVEVGL